MNREAGRLKIDLLTLAAIAALACILENVIPGPRSKLPPQSISLPRSYGWLTFGLVTALLYCVVLGPGLGPLEDDPRLG
jgi:hypothetical protein